MQIDCIREAQTQHFYVLLSSDHRTYFIHIPLPIVFSLFSSETEAPQGLVLFPTPTLSPPFPVSSS